MSMSTTSVIICGSRLNRARKAQLIDILAQSTADFEEMLRHMQDMQIKVAETKGDMC